MTLQTVRSPTGMLGLNLACSRTVVFVLCSPHRLLANTDQYSEHDPLVLGLKLASRHDLSLPRIDCPLSKTAPAGSPLLAYTFDSHTERFLKPVRSGTRLLFRFRRLGRFTAPDPLPDSVSSTSRRSPTFTPLQDFHPSGSKCSTGDGVWRSLP